MFKNKAVTTSEFAEYKLKHGNKWKFLNKEVVRKKAKKVLCRCELCGQDHWVFWRWIREGRSLNCKNCFRRPNLKEVNDRLQAEGKFVRINDVYRTRKTKLGRNVGAREYWVTCTACGSSRWLLWSHVSSMSRCGAGCRSCAMRAKVAGVPNKPSQVEQDFRKRWYRLSCLKDKPGVEWQSYEEFKDWCFSNGYALGRKLGRRKRHLPYGPSNCKFIDTLNMRKYVKNADRNRISTAGMSIRAGF